MLAPKESPPFKAFDQVYGVHALDATRDEIMPPQMQPPQDQPTRRADHILLAGPVFAVLEAIIDAALAYSGALNADEDPEEVLREATGITPEEYAAVVERSENGSWEHIAQRHNTTPAHARDLANEGLKKLRRFINT